MDGPCPTSQIQKRRLLNNFPIGSYVKTMSADGGHFEPRSGSLNTILEVDHLKTIDDMFITLSKRSDNVTFSLLQRKNFTF
jgi:hypothetical protein